MIPLQTPSTKLQSFPPIMAEGTVVMVKGVEFSYEDIARVLDYDADTGVFTWKVSINSRAQAGGRAGVWQRMQNGKDYLSITYNGRKMAGTQVAWLLHYKHWPDRSVFFVDKDTTNLQISNLKMADHKAHRVVKEDGSVQYQMSANQIRSYGLMRNYGLSMTDYAQMFARQGGVCAICQKPETAKVPGRKKDGNEDRVRDLSVDHDHETGAVRELLCNNCNHVLGSVQDDPHILRRAVEYLEKHQRKNEVVIPNVPLSTPSTERND